MSIATTTSAHPEVIEQAPTEATATSARAVVSETPPVDPSESDRMARLRQITVAAADPRVGRSAIEAAARLRCRVPYASAEQDRKHVGAAARFLVWAADGGMVDPETAFTRANVDEYLSLSATSSQRSLQQRRYFLYRMGRELHPQQFPPLKMLNAPLRQRHPVASLHEVRQLQAIIPGLPTPLGLRTQALLDLTYGAGARPADFKSLRGSAITSMSVNGHAVSVVALPNLAGGVRQVPVIDRDISARLLSLSARVGDGLVLAPTARVAERNIVNRVSEDLNRHGHPRVDAMGMRNRWILDLAARIPAVLLQQLADLCEMRILVDERTLLSPYKLRHCISVLMGSVR